MMLDVINFKDYRSILCLNGDLPDPSFFHKRKLPVIAADGAANVLCNLGVFPDLITGDLDSIQPALLEKPFFCSFTRSREYGLSKGHALFTNS